MSRAAHFLSAESSLAAKLPPMNRFVGRDKTRQRIAATWLTLMASMTLAACAPAEILTFEPVVRTTSGNEMEPMVEELNLPSGDYELEVSVHDPDSPRDGTVCGVTTNLADETGEWVLEVGDSVTARGVLSGSVRLDAGSYSLFIYNGCSTTVTLDRDS